MRLTREADYAMRCISFLAGEPERYIPQDRLARELDIPRRFLGRIIQKLVGAGILRSARGSGGGVRPARAPDEINLLEVLEAVQGPLCLNICISEPGACSQLRGCVLRPVWIKLQKTIKETLRENTFAKK